jgi:hypothetical protein
VTRYGLTAQVLRMIASSSERVVHSGSEGDPIKHALQVAADACEQVDQAESELQEATIFAAQFWYLLDRAAAILDTQPYPTDLPEGKALDAWTLVNEIYVALQAEPHAAGRVLLDELRAARIAMRAASALAGAQRRGDAEQVSRCLAVFEQRSRAYTAAAQGRAAGADAGAVP